MVDERTRLSIIAEGMNDRDLHGPMYGDRVADAVFAPTESPQARVLRAGIHKNGYQAARSLDRYLRVRVRHPQARRPQLWLGVGGKGPVTPDGVYQIVTRVGGTRGRTGSGTTSAIPGSTAAARAGT